jgi:toxin ParE1/3/4
MSKYLLSSKAKTDLKQIAAYTEKHWGRNQRNIYIKRFDNTFLILAENPWSGNSCDYVKTGYRKFPQGSHVIFYRVRQNGDICIVRILHKSMDINRLE